MKLGVISGIPRSKGILVILDINGYFHNLHISKLSLMVKYFQHILKRILNCQNLLDINSKSNFYVNGVSSVVDNFELFSYSLIFFINLKTQKKKKKGGNESFFFY